MHLKSRVFQQYQWISVGEARLVLVMANLVPWHSHLVALITGNYLMRANFSMGFSFRDVESSPAASRTIHNGNSAFLLDMLLKLCQWDLRFIAAIWASEDG